ncbi:threonine synthase [Salinibacillus xinjiangensis]|uniref:Threonine synthase n=1 Tax=Salinibacillus xinjiangensis TaxID=1229268 RepID=A0A6G1X2Q0_9BACI|nr:threonine synthase [Salinibacillus xinjiangensis]MRG85180.1 threonine synthase [Salinibacillus xinjiangensis]
MTLWRGLLEEYKELLPIGEQTPMNTLQEGNTPLVELKALSKKVNAEVYAKVEGLNPTGSFKDRGMVLAIAKALEEGSKAVICASTGNTSASAAAYASRVGLKCIIVIPDGKIAQGKLAQAVMHGAEIFSIKGNFDEALSIVKEISETEPITLVNSINPYRIEGQKTAAFEVCEQLGKAPDYLCIPVGNAGNISAYWKGFTEFNDKYQYGVPQMHGFEASGSAAIVRNEVIEQPETVATAIRIGNPASWNMAVSAAKESNGAIDEVSDEEILSAYHWLAKNEGVFAEPASCASIAGLMKLSEQGKIKEGKVVTCVLTGNGLKDPVVAVETNDIQPTVLPNNPKVIYETIRESVSK